MIQVSPGHRSLITHNTHEHPRCMNDLLLIKNNIESSCDIDGCIIQIHLFKSTFVEFKLQIQLLLAVLFNIEAPGTNFFGINTINLIKKNLLIQIIINHLFLDP